MCQARGLLEYGVDGELVLYDHRAERVHVLNTTAAAVWLLCDGTRPPGEVVAEVARLFNMAPEAVQADVRDTLGRLQRAGLLETAWLEE